MMLPRTPVYGKKSVLHPHTIIDLLHFTDFLQKSAFSQSGKKKCYLCRCRTFAPSNKKSGMAVPMEYRNTK